MAETRPATYADIAAAVAACGLTSRGGFHPGPADEVPGSSGTLILVGNAGPRMWQAFDAERAPVADSLDDWSAKRLKGVAAEFGARAYFPFERPYRPFQRWAQKAEPCHVSPLGILIHPEYGLWHGYRGALVVDERLDLPPPDRRPSPCETCPDQPCLTACPVGAFSGAGYDVPSCARHLSVPDGEDCMAFGCRARRACPVGTAYVYGPEQARFHMAAFLRNRKADGMV